MEMEKKGRENTSLVLVTSTLFFFFFVSLSYSSQENNGTFSAAQNSRQTLEIGIGSSPPAYPPDNGGCPDCTPLPEPACPEPPPPPPPPHPKLLPPAPAPPPSPHPKLLPPAPAPPPSPHPNLLPPAPPPSPPLPIVPTPSTPSAPPHSPPPSPQPPSRPPSPPRHPTTITPDALPKNLQVAIQVIQRLKNRITYDPTGITNTWKGDKICYDKSKYKGFFCYRRKGETKYRIGGVKLNGLHFDGQLAVKGFIERLSQDQVFFHVNSNNFTGDIPLEIAKIPRFYEIDLSNNKFTGAFPKPILAANLTILDLRFNKFYGAIPPQVFELDLDILFLNNNEFSGNIPENLGKLPVLYLTLANNKFTGPIPKSIGQASRNLREVLFLNNHLSGCLPYEIGLLKRTTVFDASFNQLTGPVPYSFGCLESLQVLNISNNQLYGELPDALCRLGHLQKLQFKFNYITHVGPHCRRLIKENVLDVRMNCILGLPSQRTRKQCKDFFSKPHSCPDAKHLKYVPCKIEYSRSQETRTKEVMAPSPSYAALNNRHAL